MRSFDDELWKLIQAWIDQGSDPEELIESMERRIEMMREGDDE